MSTPSPARPLTDGPIHLTPQTALAERVLLPDDPGRALRLAQALTEQPSMFNHHLGLWGYTGTAADGQPLSLQSTGLGGPSAAIVAEELIALGARRLVRLGTAVALDGDHAPGDVVAVRAALAADGTSQALGHTGELPADAELTAALERACERPAVLTASRDAFYGTPLARAWSEAGAALCDLATAAVLAVAARHGVAAGALLVVTQRGIDGERIDADALAEAERQLGERSFTALPCI